MSVITTSKVQVPDPIGVVARKARYDRGLSLRIDPTQPPPARRVLAGTRLAWLARYHGTYTPYVYAAWRNPALVEEERAATGLTGGDFVHVSQGIGIELLRDEIDRYGFYRDVYAALRRSTGPALFLGMTAGAEIEVMAAAGLAPSLCMPECAARHLAEERLLDDGVAFADLRSDDVPLRRYAAVLIAGCRGQGYSATARLASLAVRPGGVVVAECDDLAVLTELDLVGLERQPRAYPRLVVYAKSREA